MNDLKEAQHNTVQASNLSAEAIGDIIAEDVDKAEVKILEALNKLTAALVNLRNYRVC